MVCASVHGKLEFFTKFWVDSFYYGPTQLKNYNFLNLGNRNFTSSRSTNQHYYYYININHLLNDIFLR